MIRKIRNLEEGRKMLEKIGVYSEAVDIMLPKMFNHNIKFSDLPPQDAIIIKQEMLSVGGDAAISEKTLPPFSEKTDVLIMGNEKQLRRVARKLRMQYNRLAMIGEEMERLMSNLRKKQEMKIGGRRFLFGERTYIMGILNVTPDSFYDGGKFFDAEAAVKRAKEMEKEGADIIDIGGESTRPFSKRIDAMEEMKRVIPVIEAIRDDISIPISIDTYKPEVAERAIEAGANMVNDITALGNERMLEVVREYEVPVCMMHMKGRPENMQKIAHYEDVMEEIYRFLKERIEYALENGIEENRIIIDPGIGFGKRTGEGIEDNCEIIGRLEELKGLGRPILMGISRKTFIGNITSMPVEKRLEGSLGAEAIAIANGADIIRCHDVMATKKMAMVVDAIVRNNFIQQ
ncbi:MAG: dihydropteroate synthase [Thermoplasmata archaeon]|nr:dihydropteroate synthase [Thermoplasmata archaeon]